MRFIVSGGQFFADGFAVRRSFLLSEGESRLLSYISAEGCGCSALRIENGMPFLSGEGIEAIRVRGDWELFPSPTTREKRCSEKSFSLGNKLLLVRCLSGNPSEIVFGNGKFRHRAMRSLTCPLFSLLTGQRESIVVLRAHCADGNYIALFAVGEKGVRLLLEDCGEEVKEEGNEVTVRRTLPDLLGREITSAYLWRGDSFSLSRRIEYTKEHVARREEAGRLLIEAVIAKDEEAIRTLLSPDLNDPTAILDYFGEVLLFRPAPRSEGKEAWEVVKQEGEIKVAVTYLFELDAQGLIANVRCLDEE